MELRYALFLIVLYFKKNSYLLGGVMESTLKMLQESPYAWAILSLIAVVSLILAIYFGVKGNRYKRITYTKKTNRLISLKKVAVKSLHLFFNEEEIQDVSITRIAIWNSSNERIDSADIVSNKPLRVGLREDHDNSSRLLNCSIDYVTDESVFGDVDPSQLKLVNDIFIIPFDYLAPSDGVIIQIIHTGKSSDIFVDCHIKGGQKFIEVENDGSKVEQSILLTPFVYLKGSSSWGMSYFASWLILCGVLLTIEVVALGVIGLGENHPIGRTISLFIIIIPTVISVVAYPFTFIRIPHKIRKEL